MAARHVWWWRKRLPERRGEVCEVVARGRMNTILVRFADGDMVTTSRYAVRLSKQAAARRFCAHKSPCIVHAYGRPSIEACYRCGVYRPLGTTNRWMPLELLRDRP